MYRQVWQKETQLTTALWAVFGLLGERFSTVVFPCGSEHAIDDYYGDQEKYLDATDAEEAKEEAKKNEKEKETVRK